VLDGALTLASCYGVASVYELVMTRAQVRAKTREICSVALFVVVLAVTAVQVQAAFAIQVHDVRDQGYRSVVARLRQANLPPGPIATIEVGTFGYLLDRPMLDLSGLTSPNPEFITGEHSDRFFAAPPPTVLFHEPIWTFERALYDDVRFKMMYGPAVPVRDTQTPMQYFVLRPGAHAPSQEEIAAFVRQEYSAFQLQTAGPLAALQPSAQPLCVLDQINGQTAAAKPFDLPRTVLVLTGWAVDQTSGELQPDLYAVLSAGDRRYAMKAPRVSRPDVAVHLHDPRYEMAGFDLQGGLADVPPGRYRVGIAQPQREGVLYCEFPNVITLGQ
jgi:hypothetical protein